MKFLKPLVTPQLVNTYTNSRKFSKIKSFAIVQVPTDSQARNSDEAKDTESAPATRTSVSFHRYSNRLSTNRIGDGSVSSSRSSSRSTSDTEILQDGWYSLASVSKLRKSRLEKTKQRPKPSPFSVSCRDKRSKTPCTVFQNTKAVIEDRCDYWLVPTLQNSPRPKATPRSPSKHGRDGHARSKNAKPTSISHEMLSRAVAQGHVQKVGDNTIQKCVRSPYVRSTIAQITNSVR